MFLFISKKLLIFFNSGILVIERPCSIVIDVKEIFGSESKSQVNPHLHNLFENPSMDKTIKIFFESPAMKKK